MDRLKGKVAIITGSSSGIGEVTAKRFAEEGASVVINCNKDVKNGERVAAEINKDYPGKAIFVQADITKEEDWKDCIAKTKEAFGKLNILINNAGISYREDVLATTLESWNDTLAVNQTGVFLGMKYCIEAMKENGEPCAIASSASIDGIMGNSQFISYCSTKAAVQAMTRCAALYCCENKLDIRVNAVAPGYVLTPMAYEDAKQNGQTIEEYCADSAALHPIGRLAQPVEIANAYLFLVSDESSFITGTTLTVDGGYTCQ